MNWAHYLLQVNIYLIVFYGFYKLLLDKETYFLLNRIYLIAAGILSLAIPLLKFEWFVTPPIPEPGYTNADQLNQMITQMNITPQTTENFNLGNLAVLLYLSGVFFFTAKFIYQLFSVHFILKNRHDGSAFSFLNKKSIDNALPELQTIHKHEEVHIKQYHTLDVLLFEALGIIAWFNPIIYFYKQTVKNIHEYLADEEAAKFQGDKKAYALLLLSSAFKVAPSSLINSFYNKSLIKKRIFMLHKERSGKAATIKYGLSVPLFALIILLSSATIRNNEKIQAIADEIPLEQPFNLVKDVLIQNHLDLVKRPAPEKSRNTTGVIGKINQDWQDFYLFIKRSIRYPAAAQASGLQGNSQIKFTIKDGEIEGLGIAFKPLGLGSDAEVMKTILAYKGYKENPDGNYTLTVSFKINGSDTPLKNDKIEQLNGYTPLNDVVVTGYKKPIAATDGEKIYDFVAADQPPGFPGGMAKFYNYLKQSMKYPALARERKVEGKVFLSFIVEKDGRLEDIEVDKTLGAGTDEEAVRVLKESPAWVPGIKDGKPVRVQYSIPVSFKLPGTETAAPGDKAGSTKDKSEGKDSVSAIRVEGYAKAPSVKISAQKTRGFKSETTKTGNTLTISAKAERTPLYIIDGIKADEEQMKYINPGDIQAINVLKDSKAITIYGDEGKNGVVLITTKKNNSEKYIDSVKPRIKE